MSDDENSVNPPDTILGGIILGGFVATAVIAALFTLGPWSGRRAAEHASHNTTVGVSTNRPPAPASHE